MRSKVQREELMLKEKGRKEQELRALAQKARSERSGMAPAPGAPVYADKSMVDDDMRVEHHETRKETRDAAMEKKSKITRDMDRDTSEKISVGMANTGAGRTGEVMYDQRLFIQEKGMDSGHVADGHHNIYDKGLFTAHPTLSTLYRPKTDSDTDMYGGADEQPEKVFKTDGFKPDKAFTGASERQRPIEFVTGKRCDIFGYEAVMARINLKRRRRRLDDDDEIDGDGASVLITDRYGSYGLYRIFITNPIYKPISDIKISNIYNTGWDHESKLLLKRGIINMC